MIVVETPALETVFETTFATVIPTEVSHVTISTTVLNNVTTTIPVFASATIDYTVTVVESETTTNTVLETQTVTETAGPLVVTPYVYVRDNEDDGEYDIPEYASSCTDIHQYSSACSCVGFVPRTSTAAAPKTTSTVVSTVTPSTSVRVSTIQGGTATRNATTVPVTTTVSTVSISRAVETITSTTIVATDSTTLTETTTTTEIPTPVVPLPAPTETIQLSVDDTLMAERINVPPGAHIGVIMTVRATTNPATFILHGGDGSVDMVLPVNHAAYSLYYYHATNAGYSYIQITTETVANILGVRKLSCSLSSTDEFMCDWREDLDGELWLCGRHLAIVTPGNTAFAAQCSAVARRVTVDATRV